MVYKGANLDRTPLNILSTALLFTVSSSFNNSQAAGNLTSKQTAQLRLGDCRRFDSDVGERFIAEVPRCLKSKSTTEMTVAFLGA